MDKLIVANLKMNLVKNEIINYKKTVEASDISNLIISPSSIYLPYMKSNKYGLCSQNAYYEDDGAYTGEISYTQLKSIGVDYSLIGHSERRHIFNENNEIISKKINACIKNGIVPILCIGETKEERDNNKIYEVLKEQLLSAINNNIDNMIIAYEPVWAIGTGVIPTMEEIEHVHIYISKIVKEDFNKDYKILYGGSVNPDNIINICKLESVDGVLIGSASNDPSDLINMYNKTKKM